MAITTRLDAVVRYREQREKDAQVAFAAAAARVRAAWARVEALRDELERQSGTPRRTVDEWEIAQGSALRLQRRIEEETARARDAEREERAARTILEAAHREAEAVRRAAEARRAAIRLELEKAERKELDAFGQLLHVRRRSD